MSIVKVTKALEKRLASMPLNISTFKEGLDNKPVEGTPYQTEVLIPSVPLNPTFGDTYYREVGTYRIRLFYPSRQGKGAILTQAERIRDWFYRGLSLNQDDITVIIERTPTITSTTLFGDRISIAVDVIYFASVYN